MDLEPLRQPAVAFAIYAAINLLTLLVLAMIVTRRRRETGTPIGDGGIVAMIKAQRAHGNAVEYIPTGLLAVFALLMLGAPGWLVHVAGGTLTVGRILHAIGLSQSAGDSPPRTLGILLTWISFLAGGAGCLWLAFR